MKIIAGLGNPGEEYNGTRHNVGRMALDFYRKKNDFPEWREDKKLKALSSEGKIGKEKVLLLLPESFMNKSGDSLKTLVTSAKKAEELTVVYDDMDLALGVIKISFNRGSGGHKGLESIIKAVKTEGFNRLRIGTSPVTPSGKIKKPQGEKAVIDFIMTPFKKAEAEEFKKVCKKSAEALEMIVSDGREKAMGKFN